MRRRALRRWTWRAPSGARSAAGRGFPGDRPGGPGSGGGRNAEERGGRDPPVSSPSLGVVRNPAREGLVGGSHGSIGRFPGGVAAHAGRLKRDRDLPLVYIGIGSNLGDREGLILGAIERMRAFAPVRKVSALRETEPVGMTGQPGFLNAVAELETDRSPRAVLEALLRIEKNLGRTRTGKWGAAGDRPGSRCVRERGGAGGRPGSPAPADARAALRSGASRRAGPGLETPGARPNRPRTPRLPYPALTNLR